MEKLIKLGDLLEKLNEYINWKIFSSPIKEAFKDERKDKRKGGRPPFNKSAGCIAINGIKYFKLNKDPDAFK